MKVDVVTVGSFQKKVNVTVPAEKVRSELDQAYRTLGQKVRLKGFRPGKAPKQLLEARYGDQVRSDVANSLIQGVWQDAMRDHDIQPVSRPNLENAEPVKVGSDFQFTITVDVRPDVTIEKYTGVEVVFPRSDVPEEEIDAAVKQRAEAAAKLVDVTDRPVREGDMVITELTAKDGKEVVAQEVGTMIRTDADPYYPGVESLLIGLKLNGKAKGKVTFSEDARTEAIRGRTLDVAVVVKGIQASEIPPITDELASELGFEGGVQGMRLAIQLQAQGRREELARNQARANLLEVLIRENPFSVPSAMVDESLKMLLEELKIQTAWRSGRNPNTVTFSEAQVRDLRGRAEFASKSGLILDYVTKKEQIEVTDTDIAAKYQELADSRGQTVEAVKGYFEKDAATDELRARLLEEKTLDWLLERAKLVNPETPVAAPSGALAEVAENLVAKAVEEKQRAKKARQGRGEEPADAAPKAVEAAATEEKPKKKAAKKTEEAPAAEEPVAEAKPAKKKAAATAKEEPAAEASGEEKPKKKAPAKKKPAAE
jgi:trigger factor